MKSSKKKYYRPQKTFAEDLNGLVGLFKIKGWAFSNVDVAVLEQDVQDQNAEKQNQKGLEGAFVNARETLSAAQAARFRRYSTAFKAASEAFRDDPGIAAELAQYKRSFRRRKSNGGNGTSEKQPVASSG